MRIATVVLVAACACGSRANPQPTSHPIATSTVAAGPDAPTDRECEQLIAHAVELRVGELRATKPAQVPTDADQDAARRDIAALLGADCRRISRAMYACGVAAKTTTELAGCDH